MIDPTQPSVGERLLSCVRDGVVKVPQGLIMERLMVSKLGAGESYAAWLLSNGHHKWVVRLPRRPLSEMPCSMSEEFAAARAIPADVGSRGVAMDDSADNALGSPYIVTSYVPGKVLPPRQWSLSLLRHHARQLALLHSSPVALSGPFGVREATIDIVQEFDDGLRWWQESHAAVTESAEVVLLARDIRAQLVRAAPAFEGIPLSFIHGDLVATNVVVDPSGVPRYIDWEWAKIGDVAQDLAYIGGPVTGGPWYVPMDAETVIRFLTEYQTALIARSADELSEPLERLQRRRNAWELTERFLSSLHFSKQASVRGEMGSYGAAARELRLTLRWRLDDLQRGEGAG